MKYIRTTISHYGKPLVTEYYPVPKYNIVTADKQIRQEYPKYENYMVTVREVSTK